MPSNRSESRATKPPRAKSQPWRALKRFWTLLMM
ncbi:hypothetical protein J2Y55_000096 [Bosea sp. BE125]|nr:hypothetical protein [Bosea sp. BE125]